MKSYFNNNRLKVMTVGVLTIIIGLCIFLSSFQIGKLSFWLDEAYTFLNSKNSLIEALNHDPNMRLYYALANIWIRIFPNASDGLLRALSAVFSVASIPVVFLLGRSLVTDQKKATAIGLIAAFLITINAYFIRYAQEFRSYSLTLLLTALSTFLLIKVIEDSESKHHWPIWYTIVSAAAIYSHLFALFLIASQAATLPILLINKNKNYYQFKRLAGCGFGIVCLILPIPISVIIKGEGLSGIAWISEPTLSTVKSFLIAITGNQGKPLFALYLLSGCIGIFSGLGFKQDFITKWKYALMASCLFLPVILTLAISKIIFPIFQAHYLLYVMPYLAVFAATGIVALASFRWKSIKYRPLFIPVGIGVLVLFALLSTNGIQSYYENYQKTDWRNATQLLTTRCSEGLRLYYAPFMDISVLYYNPALNSQEAEWWTNILKHNPDVDELAVSLPNEYSQVCLVLTMTGDQNQRNIVRAALQKKFSTVSDAKFYEMDVYIYQR